MTSHSNGGTCWQVYHISKISVWKYLTYTWTELDIALRLSTEDIGIAGAGTKSVGHRYRQCCGLYTKHRWLLWIVPHVQVDRIMAHVCISCVAVEYSIIIFTPRDNLSIKKHALPKWWREQWTGVSHFEIQVQNYLTLSSWSGIEIMLGCMNRVRHSLLHNKNPWLSPWVLRLEIETLQTHIETP